MDLKPVLYCDCKPAIALAKTDESRTLKHIVKLSYHFVRQLFEQDGVCIEWVATDDQVADILTKPLPQEKFVFFRNLLMNVSA